MREMAPNIQFPLKYTHLFPTLSPYIAEILTNGATGLIWGGAPVPPRARGLPYRPNDPAQAGMAWSKLRNAIVSKRFFHCAARMVGLPGACKHHLPPVLSRKIPIAHYRGSDGDSGNETY